MIFISHRKTDENCASIFVDFLKILGVPSEEIFCSSLPGNDVKYKIDTEIKNHLQCSRLDILILSADFFKSAYCLNEEGIIWYKDTPKIVIALPEITENNLVGFIDGNYILRRLDSIDDISNIYDEISALYDLKNKSTIINNEICKLINNYQEFLGKRKQAFMASAESNIDILCEDEAIVLYYIWQNQTIRVAESKIKTWLISNELYNVDILNGFNLLEAGGKGKVNMGTMSNCVFEMNNNQFRQLIAKKEDEIIPIRNDVLSHYHPSKETFIHLWQHDMPDAVRLLVAYLYDEHRQTLGARWRSETEIELIKIWEDKYCLDSTLSQEYKTCLQFFIDNNIVFPSDYTSEGNPRQYTLHKSFCNFLFDAKFPYLDDLQAIKDTHNIDLPF